MVNIELLLKSFFFGSSQYLLDVAQLEILSSQVNPQFILHCFYYIRRRFTTDYKLRILREAEACGYGGIGAILRREGLYSGQLSTWRKQQEAGLSPQKRGRKAAKDPLAREKERLEKENRRLAERLRKERLRCRIRSKAEIIIHVQKKLCDVLERLRCRIRS